MSKCVVRSSSEIFYIFSMGKWLKAMLICATAKRYRSQTVGKHCGDGNVKMYCT